MRRVIVAFIIPFVAQANDLRDYIRHIHKSDLYRSKSYSVMAKGSEIDAVKSKYLPTIDIGASYNYNDPVSIPKSPDKTAVAFAKISLTLFDGGIKSYQILSKEYERSSAEFERRAFAKDAALNVTKSYFGILKLRALLRALRVRQGEIKAQLNRVEKFYKSGIANKDDLYRLKAAYQESRYNIENTKQMLLSAKEGLKLLSGLSVNSIKEVRFVTPKRTRFRVSDQIRALREKSKAVGESANMVAVSNYPKVMVSDTYKVLKYPDFPASSKLIDHQNTLSVNLNMRLFDGGSASAQSESIRYNQLALESQINHLINQQKMNYKLAKENLKTLRVNINSTLSALKAANINYKKMKANYENGLIDNTAYLDALSQKTMAYARYKQTIYELEIAKAVLYHYAGASLVNKIRRVR